MNSAYAIKFLILFILIFLSAFFSSSETAFSTINKMKIRSLVEEGNKSAMKVQLIIEDYNKMISAVLIGNNIVNISASALATALAIEIWGDLAIGIMTGVLTIVILIFGEIVPKTWASLNSEKIALLYSNIIYFLMIVLTPVIFIINFLANIVFRFFRIDLKSKKALITESELKTIVDVSHEGGIIEAEERAMIYNLFDFSDSLAKDIMIPRINMNCVNLDASHKELLAIFKDCMYTRIPVFKESTDNIIGIINIKDLVLIEDPNTFQIKDIIRNTHYTYEYKKTADLLFEMREISSSITFVINEYGATIGLITLEDLLEEIVGEIRDEYDQDECELITTITPFEYLIAGDMKLDDINNAIGTNFESEDYDSIGGVIIEYLDRIPSLEEKITTSDNIIIKVEAVNQNRIERVRVTLPTPSISEEESTSQNEE